MSTDSLKIYSTACIAIYIIEQLFRSFFSFAACGGGMGKMGGDTPHPPWNPLLNSNALD